MISIIWPRPLPQYGSEMGVMKSIRRAELLNMPFRQSMQWVGPDRPLVSYRRSVLDEARRRWAVERYSFNLSFSATNKYATSSPNAVQMQGQHLVSSYELSDMHFIWKMEKGFLSFLSTTSVQCTGVIWILVKNTICIIYRDRFLGVSSWWMTWK